MWISNSCYGEMDPPLPQDMLNQMYANDSWYIAKMPRFERLLSEPRIMISVLSYTLVFQFLSYLTRRFLWHRAEGFRQYRLRNITICFIHSTFCGLFVLYFALTRFQFMVNNPVFYNEKWMPEILLFSIGYFIHDAIHMLKFELSRWTIELLIHHIITASVLMIAFVSDFFISFAYWSLLMELNSVFLHMRTLFQLSNASKTRPDLFTAIQHGNIITCAFEKTLELIIVISGFVVFRFISPAIQLQYVFNHRHNFRLFYLIVSFGSGVVFFVINVFLFIRILASDGYLGEYGRKHTAIGRDKQTDQKANGKTD
ncbi:TLC domain-containing protein [Aphelenchoides bicaudatus]|nr:TLC domain-containing protein [Aphelenchoides bicaudatus]